MRKLRTAHWASRLLPGLLVLLCAVPTSAADFELTPFVGYQFGGTFEEDFDDDDDFDFFDDVDIEESESYGLILDIGLSKNAQVEFLYSHQDSSIEESGFFGDALGDVEIEYFHAGLLWQWGAGQVKPFVVASGGATRFSFADDSDTRFSAAIGGGVKVLVSEHVGFRFDGRLYSTFIEEDEEISCNRNGRRCYRYNDDISLVQLDVKFGVIFAF